VVRPSKVRPMPPTLLRASATLWRCPRHRRRCCPRWPALCNLSAITGGPLRRRQRPWLDLRRRRSGAPAWATWSACERTASSARSSASPTSWRPHGTPWRSSPLSHVRAHRRWCARWWCASRAWRIWSMNWSRVGREGAGSGRGAGGRDRLDERVEAERRAAAATV